MGRKKRDQDEPEDYYLMEAEKMDYDVVIIGGGPNGETVGSYMAKAGAKCLIVERRDEMGGGLVTEDFGGFRFNLHATYSMMADKSPPIKDLFLAQYGASVIRPEVQLHYAPAGRQSITVYSDLAKTVQSIKKLSEKEANAFSKMYTDLVEMNERYIIPFHFVPPSTPEEQQSRLGKSELGRKVLAIAAMSPLEILDHYGIENDSVKAASIYAGCLWGVEPSTRGVGHMFAFFLYRMTNAGLVSGGSHRLSSSLLRSYYENGGEVMENTIVKKVIVKDGQAKGVMTESGKELTAKAIVSTLNPHQTFLDLVGEEHLERDLIQSVKRWKWDDWSMFMVHLGVRGLPVYHDPNGEGKSGALLQLIGYDGLDEILEHWKDCTAGKMPSPAGGWTNTSEIDPTQSPEGFHTVRMETQVPFEVPRTNWEDLKNTYGERCIEEWRASVENSHEIEILKRYYYPPTYLEMKLTTMAKGSIKHGAYIPSQMGYFRPHESCSGSRTPIKNFYVAGASVHPGGMITLGPGYIAANVIAEDLGLKQWWPTPEFLSRARKEQLIA